MPGSKRRGQIGSLDRRAEANGPLHPVPLVGGDDQIDVLEAHPDRDGEDEQGEQRRAAGADALGYAGPGRCGRREVIGIRLGG